MTQLTEQDATAADTGAHATRVFQNKAKATAPSTTARDRVSLCATEALAALHEIVRRNHISYAEYDAVKAWVIKLGQDGEWPLFLDVFVEHTVEAEVNADRKGSKGSIEGPFYVPGAPELGSTGTLPMRTDEAGTPLVFRGQVRAVDGTALAGAQVEIWQADADGYYAQFAPAIPEWNLRGTLHTDQVGNFAVRTIQPAAYQIPHDGATGQLIAAAGWHAWRPAHLHLRVSAPDHRSVTTQLYFAGSDYLDSDIATAVKPELILDPKPTVDGTHNEVDYDFVLAPV
jgi:catechol 1,2-dioxygenase